MRLPSLPHVNRPPHAVPPGIGLWGMAAALLLAACGGSSTLPPVLEPEIGECFWAVESEIWADLDGSSVRDPQEPPLEGIRVEIRLKSDPGNVYTSGVSAYDGLAEAGGISAGDCDFEQFSAEVIAPAGYTVTTQNPVDLAGFDFQSDRLSFGLQPPPDVAIPTLAPPDLACEQVGDLAARNLSIAPNGQPVFSYAGSFFYGEHELERWDSASYERLELTPSGAVWAVLVNRESAGYTRDGTSWEIFEGRWLAYLSPPLLTGEDGTLWFATTYQNDVTVLGYHPQTGEVTGYASRWRGAEGPEALIVARYNDEWFAALVDDVELPASAPEGWEIIEARVLDEVGSIPLALADQPPKHVAASPDGLLWIAIDGRAPNTDSLYRYDTARNAWLNVSPEDVQGEFERVKELAVAPDGTVWILSGRQRDILMSFKDDTWRMYRGGYDDRDSYQALATGDGFLWLAGSEVIMRCEVLP